MVTEVNLLKLYKDRKVILAGVESQQQVTTATATEHRIPAGVVTFREDANGRVNVWGFPAQ
jgi:hypothetical protein